MSLFFSELLCHGLSIMQSTESAFQNPKAGRENVNMDGRWGDKANKTTSSAVLITCRKHKFKATCANHVALW